MEDINFSIYTSAAKSTEEHSLIIQAIEAKDIALARQNMENNWLRFVEVDLIQLDSSNEE